MLNALRTQLIDVMANDAALTALLHSAEAIYSYRPPKSLDLPCITVHLADRPDEDAARYGRTVAELRLEIWSASGDTNDAVVAALDDLLFDAHRSGGLDTDDLRVGACRRTASREGDDPAMRSADGAPVLRRETLWRLVVLKKGA